jgi:hypothetical protein
MAQLPRSGVAFSSSETLIAPYCRIEIVELEGDILNVNITISGRQLLLIGEIAKFDDQLLELIGVHVQGLRPGELGRAGLNAIGRQLMVEARVGQIIIYGGRRSTGRKFGTIPRPIVFPR